MSFSSRLSKEQPKQNKVTTKPLHSFWKKFLQPHFHNTQIKPEHLEKNWFNVCIEDLLLQLGTPTTS